MFAELPLALYIPAKRPAEEGAASLQRSNKVYAQAQCICAAHTQCNQRPAPPRPAPGSSPLRARQQRAEQHAVARLKDLHRHKLHSVCLFYTKHRHRHTALLALRHCRPALPAQAPAPPTPAGARPQLGGPPWRGGRSAAARYPRLSRPAPQAACVAPLHQRSYTACRSSAVRGAAPQTLPPS